MITGKRIRTSSYRMAAPCTSPRGCSGANLGALSFDTHLSTVWNSVADRCRYPVTFSESCSDLKKNAPRESHSTANLRVLRLILNVWMLHHGRVARPARCCVVVSIAIRLGPCVLHITHLPTALLLLLLERRYEDSHGHRQQKNG